MKRKRLLTVMPGLALALLLALGACDMDPPEEPEEAITELSATAANFAKTITDIKTPGRYRITLTENLENFEGVEIKEAGVYIIVRGAETSTEISGDWTKESNKRCFLVKEGTTLVLENIKITCAETTSTTDWWHILGVRGGTLEIKTGALITGKDAEKTQGVCLHMNFDDSKVIMSGGEISHFAQGIEAPFGTFTMTGGTIHSNVEGISRSKNVNIREGTITENDTGMAVWGDASSVTLAGGTISKNTIGVGVWTESKNATITLSGTTIAENSYTGVYLQGENTQFTMSGGNIEDTASNSINFDTNGKNNTFTMTAGTISGGKRGISVDGDGHKLTINGGTIENNNDYGIRLGGNGKNLTFAMTGGTIRGSGSGWGISMGSADSSLNISGGTINGKEAANTPNKSGAVTVQGGKSRTTTFTSGSLEAKTDAEKNGVADSFKGNWD